MYKLANIRAYRNGLDPDEVLEKTQKEFKDLGALLFSFDSGTSPAVKQMRHKLLMANAGAVNFELDEIGSNLIGNTEVLNTFLELFDVGKVKTKLIKNTNDSKRNEEIDGKTPTNMMLFGTSSSLLIPGSQVENSFMNFLETGYARRCFFGYTTNIKDDLDITPEELYLRSTDKTKSAYLQKLSDRFRKLGDEINFGTNLTMSRDVAILISEYHLNCKKQAAILHEHQPIRKSELKHRYYKVTKLAGTYAFIDGSIDIKEQHVLQAIKLAEESGEALISLLQRPKPHEVLAKFIVEANTELTQVEIMDHLPFFKGSASVRNDLMNRASAYGYKNNIILKRHYADEIEFFSGESLALTNLDEMIISCSPDIAEGYKNQKAPFSKLHKLTQLSNYHYTNHYLNNGLRNKQNMIQGFNLIILDIDGGVKLSTAKMLLQEYKALYYTTKSHTPENHRFRIILPISHVVNLDEENFKQFMENVYSWLPFQIDTGTKDPVRKWATHKGAYKYHDGKLLDALKFIPNTSAEEKQTKQILDRSKLPALERWFHINMGTNIGNRNNQLLKYAMVLVDLGYTFADIQTKVLSFNKQLKCPLSESEIDQTIMTSIHQKLVTS